jgi:hypothetical protein
MFASAFSDLNVTIHEQVAEGDTVVTRMSFVGTHQPPPFPLLQQHALRWLTNQSGNLMVKEHLHKERFTDTLTGRVGRRDVQLACAGFLGTGERKSIDLRGSMF